MTTESNEKYQKLAAEYSKLRSQVTVLKKAVVEEQDKREKIEDEVKNRDVSLRKLQQEVDSLVFRNQQLSSRVEILQQELDTSQLHSKKSKAQKPHVLPVPNHVDTSVFGEELQSKIRENMELHSKLVEVESKYEQEVKDLRGQVSLLQSQQQNFEQVLQDAETKNKMEVEKLQDKRIAMELALHRKDKEIQDEREKVKDLSSKLSHLQGTLGKDLSDAKEVIAHKVPFNDSADRLLLCLDLPTPDHAWDTWIQQLLRQVQLLTSDLVQAYVDLLTYWEQRVGIFPIDPQWDTVSDEIKQNKDLLHRNAEYFRPIQNSVQTMCEKAQSMSLTRLELLELRPVSACVNCLVEYLNKLLPLQLHCLDTECNLSMCPENLVLKNRTVAAAQSHLYKCIVNTASSLSAICDSKSRSSQATSVSQLCQSVSQLAAATYDFSQLYHSKVALEHSLATTSHKLRVTNECILKSFNSILNTTNKLNDLLNDSESQLLKPLKSCGEQFMPPAHPCVQVLAKRTAEYLGSVNTQKQPDSVPYTTALHAYKRLHSSTESRETLASQVQILQEQVTELEQAKEHWLLESKLLQAKLERKDTEATVESSESHMGSAGREVLIKQHYTQKIAELTTKIQQADSKILAFYTECKSIHYQLASLEEENHDLQEKLQTSTGVIASLKDELQTTSSGYTEQLSTLSEHLAVMNDKLAHQQDEIQDLRAKQVPAKGGRRGFLQK